jgi:preprotein translocase subunit SecF
LRGGNRRPAIVADMQPFRLRLRYSRNSNIPVRKYNMRTLLLFVALLALIGVVLVKTGYLNLNRGADGNLSVQTRDINVGSTTTNVQVPVVRMETRQVEVPSVGVTGNQTNTQ